MGSRRLLLALSEEDSWVVKVATPNSYNSYFCFSFTQKADTLGSVFPFELQCSKRRRNKGKFAATHMEMTLGKLDQSLAAFNLILEEFFRAANYLKRGKQPEKTGITQLSVTSY